MVLPYHHMTLKISVHHFPASAITKHHKFNGLKMTDIIPFKRSEILKLACWQVMEVNLDAVESNSA